MGRKLTLRKKTGGKEKPVKIRVDFDTAMKGFLFTAIHLHLKNQDIEGNTESEANKNGTHN